MGSSPGSDRMEWSPSSPAIVFYRSEEPWTGIRSGQRRSFDEISDGSEPQGREESTPASLYIPQQDSGEQEFFPTDCHLGTIPRIGKRAALCLLYMGHYLLGCAGKGLGYANVAVKRRLSCALRAQHESSLEENDTPQKRRQWSPQFTPRKMYDTRSPRSGRTVDMPGRFPGFPLACYTRADPYKHKSPRGFDHLGHSTPESQDIALQRSLDGNTKYEFGSPIALKQSKRVIQETTALQNKVTYNILTQKLPIDLARSPLHINSNNTLHNGLNKHDKLVQLGNQNVAPDNYLKPDHILTEQSNGNLNKKHSWLDTARMSHDDLDQSSLLDADLSSISMAEETLYDPHNDPALAIVPEARLLQDRYVGITDELFDAPTWGRQTWATSNAKNPPDSDHRPPKTIKSPPKSISILDKLQPGAGKGPCQVPDLPYTNYEEHEQNSRSETSDFAGASEDVETSPIVQSVACTSYAEHSNHTPEPNLIAEHHASIGGAMKESTASETESSDTSQSLVSAVSASPTPVVRSALSAIDNNQVSIADQLDDAPRKLHIKGKTPPLISKVARFFGYRRPKLQQQSLGSTRLKISPKFRKSVGFYESPETGRPVTKTKRFVIGESIDHPSPLSSRDESSILTIAGLQTGSDWTTAAQDQAAIDAQLQVFHPESSFGTGSISPDLGEVSFESTEASHGTSGHMHDGYNHLSDSEKSLENASIEVERTDADTAMRRCEKEHKDGDHDPNVEERKEQEQCDQEQLHRELHKEKVKEKHEKNKDEDKKPEGNEDKMIASVVKIRNSDEGVKKGEANEMHGSGMAVGVRHEQTAASDEGYAQPRPRTPRVRTPSTSSSSKKAKRKDLSGALEELSISPGLNISPRRASLRHQSLIEKAAREQAAREAKEAEEKARREKEEEERRAEAEREAEEQRKKLSVRRLTKDPIIQPLSEEWDMKVDEAMGKGIGIQVAITSTGSSITRRDVGKVLPQPGVREDDQSGWLNDEVIAAYLQAVVDHGNSRFNLRRGDTPKLHAFNTFFYTNLKKPGGYDNVKRWARRAKIGGKDLLGVEWVFIPVNVGGNHWTLAVVSPVRKTIEYFDSLHGSAAHVVNNVRAWLAGELGTAYSADEWIFADDEHGHYIGRGKGPTQLNGSDCGVFTITTAKMVSLGIDPLAVSGSDTPLQRRRIVAELINGGFSGEFEPKFELV